MLRQWSLLNIGDDLKHDPGVRGNGEPAAVVLRYIANNDEWEAPV